MSATDDWRDEQRAQLIENIERFGYTHILVGSGECSVEGCRCEPEPYPYAYTLGMIEYDHPELVVFGASLCCVNRLTGPVFAAAEAGTPLTVGREQRHELDDGATIVLLDVPELWLRRDPGRIGGWLDLFGPRGGLPPFVQVVFADRHGVMPWEPGCDAAVAALQPLLDDDPLRYPRPPRTRSRHRRRARR